MTSAPLWITEADVAELIDLPTAIGVVEDAFRAEAQGFTTALEKTHATWGGGHTLHAIGAVASSAELAGTKTWVHSDGNAEPLLILWSASTGQLRAVIDAFALGQLRTAAVSGVATRWLSDPDADRLAVIGSGRQALPQIAAVAAVRNLRSIAVHSPTPAHRDALVIRLEQLGWGCEVQATDTVEQALAGASIVTTVTRARAPFVHSSAVAPGTHINAVGAITPERRELSADVVGRAGVVAADSVSAARRLAVELEPVRDIVRLSDVVAASGTFARGPDLTIFKAMGVGLGDVALGGRVLERALAAGTGRPLRSPQRVAPRLADRQSPLLSQGHSHGL